MNEAEAANATAKTKALGSKPICCVTASAIGVIIIAVAAFEDISVKIMVIRYMRPSKTCGCISVGADLATEEIKPPIHSAVPVFCITIPTGISADINTMTCQFID
jgi:hypothetical protein